MDLHDIAKMSVYLRLEKDDRRQILYKKELSCHAPHDEFHAVMSALTDKYEEYKNGGDTEKYHSFMMQEAFMDIHLVDYNHTFISMKVPLCDKTSWRFFLNNFYSDMVK